MTGNIMISGGKITALRSVQQGSSAVQCGTGIGSGSSGPLSGSIIISGGEIYAKAGDSGNAIGIGAATNTNDSDNTGKIIISDGCVYAIGSGNSAAIGFSDGINEECGIEITGGLVKAEGGMNSTSTMSSVPCDADGNELDILNIDNTNGNDLTVNGKSYPSAFNYNDGTADHTEKTLSLYVPINRRAEVVLGGNDPISYYYTDQNKFEIIDGIQYDVYPTDISDTLKYGDDFTYDSDTVTLTINTTTPVTIKNIDPSYHCGPIKIGGYDADITLAGVKNRTYSNQGSGIYVDEDNTNNIKITLADGTENECIVNATDEYSAIRCSSSTLGSLTITCEHSEEPGHICDSNCGSLIASTTGKNTVAEGASSRIYSAAIGSGKDMNAGNITINGGNITAISTYGAAIGCGKGGKLLGKITINGGVINADSSLGKVSSLSSCAIGSNSSDASSGKIIINGGIITAECGKGKYDIDGGDIIIDGGVVLLKENQYQNKKPFNSEFSPKNSSGDKVYLLTINNENGEEVKINGNALPYKYLSDSDKNLYLYCAGSPVTVEVGSAAYRYALSGDRYLRIGSDLVIKAAYGGAICIGGGNINAVSTHGAAIGGGMYCVIKDINDNGGITITGGIIYAKSNNESAAIGSGNNGDASSITIENCRVTATGKILYAAAIGSSKDGNASDIKIENAYISAISEGGAAIGSGLNGKCNGITITDSVVYAETSYGAAVIGGGKNGIGDNITIKESIVSLNSTDYFPQGNDIIGNGCSDNSQTFANASNIVISRSSVKVDTSIQTSPIKDDATLDPAQVYLLIFDNPNGAKIYVDGSEAITKGYNNTAAAPRDTSIYLWVTESENHDIILEAADGTTTTFTYHFNPERNTNVHANAFKPCRMDTISGYAHDENGHWYKCSGSDTCTKKYDYSPHQYSPIWEYTTDEHWRVCSVCGAKSKAESHKFGNWVITKPATASSTGIKTRTCAICGTTETDTIPKKSSGGSGATPSRPTTPSESKPSLNGVEKSWAEIAADIAKFPSGGTAVICMNGQTNVPADVIKAIRDTKSKIEFVNDSSRSWSVDGSRIITASAADFSILPGTADKSALRGVAGADIKLNNIGVPADLKLTFRKEFAGQFANLYKITDSKLVFQICVKVGDDGAAIVSDVDASGEYVVMLCEFSDLRGDMNNDGVLNAFDASAILKSIIGLEAGKNPLMADFNGDDTVNAFDVSAILRQIISLK